MSNPLLLKNSTQTALPDNTVQPTSTPSLDYTTFTQNWTQTPAISANWSAISSSANGQYVSACINPGAIYTSNNYGTTWTAITTSNGVSNNSLAWTGIALSASGQYQIATVNTGAIYYSSTFGASWTASATAASSIVASGTKSIAVAVSSSGIYATAVVTGGQIWYTINYGANWTAITTNEGVSSNTLNWSAITMSSTGVTQVATISTGLIYYSLNTGQTWTASNAASSAWAAVAMSASGQYVTAVAGPNIISSSSDYGKTWTNQSATFAWQAVAVSSSGQYQIVAGGTGGTGVIYYSTNYGSTWVTSTNSYNVKCATMSHTGQYVMVAVNGGLVYCAITRAPGLFTSGSIIAAGTITATGAVSTKQPFYLTNTGFTNSNLLNFYNGTNSYTLQQIDMSGANYLRLGRNGYDDLCIGSGGNVGIGTNAPTCFLHINPTATNQKVIDFAPGGSTTAFGIYAQVEDTANRGYSLSWYARDYNNNTGITTRPVLTMGITGNVGIGITNPSQILYVNANVSTAQTVMIAHFASGSYSNGNYGSLIGLSSEPSSWAKVAFGHVRTNGYDVGDMVFLTRSAVDNTTVTMSDERMRITSSGYVGIGTNAPSTCLHVFGSSYAINGSITNVSAFNNTPSLILTPNTSATNAAVFMGVNTIGGGGGAGFAINRGGSADTYIVAYTSTSNGGLGGITQGPSVGSGGVAWSTTSDMRLKENWKSIDNSLDKLSLLTTGTYNFISRSVDQRHYGLIAQELQVNFPEMVMTDPNGYLSVTYTDMIPVLVKAFQEQNIINIQQSTNIASQENEIATLKEQMATVLSKLA
jgi:hypothetical protein